MFGRARGRSLTQNSRPAITSGRLTQDNAQARPVLWSAVASGARHRFGTARSDGPAPPVAESAAVWRRTPKTGASIEVPCPLRWSGFKTGSPRRPRFTIRVAPGSARPARLFSSSRRFETGPTSAMLRCRQAQTVLDAGWRRKRSRTGRHGRGILVQQTLGEKT